MFKSNIYNRLLQSALLQSNIHLLQLCVPSVEILYLNFGFTKERKYVGKYLLLHYASNTSCSASIIIDCWCVIVFVNDLKLC